VSKRIGIVEVAAFAASAGGVPAAAARANGEVVLAEEAAINVVSENGSPRGSRYDPADIRACFVPAFGARHVSFRQLRTSLWHDGSSVHIGHACERRRSIWLSFSARASAASRSLSCSLQCGPDFASPFRGAGCRQSQTSTRHGRYCNVVRELPAGRAESPSFSSGSDRAVGRQKYSASKITLVRGDDSVECVR
jgi:hypothetical protein